MTIPRISEQAREARRPLPVSTLLSARQETIHRDPGAARAARSVKVSDKLPTIDDVRAAAEKAKAWRPKAIGDDPNATVVLSEEYFGAMRAVDDIAEHVDNAVRNLRNNAVQPDRPWREAATASADRAARISSYFASEPNPVSEFRDKVRKFVEAGK